LSEQKLSDGERERLRGMVRELLEEAEAVLDAVPVEEQPHHTEEVVAVCYARLGDFAAARRLVDRWTDQCDRADILVPISKCQRVLSNQSVALTTIHDAAEAAKLGEDVDSRIGQLAEIARLLNEWGETSRSRSVLTEATRIATAAADPCARRPMTSVDELIDGYIQLSDWSMAESVAEDLLREFPDYRSSPIRGIAAGLAKAGEIDEAIRLAQSIPELLTRTHAMHAIADAKTADQTAIEILRECFGAYQQEEDHECRALKLKSLATSMSARSLRDDAVRSLISARESVLLMSSYYYRTLHLAGLASDFIDLGHLEDARDTLRIAEEVAAASPHKNAKSYQCIAIAKQYIKLGDKAKARSLIEAAEQFAWVQEVDHEMPWLPCEVVDDISTLGFIEIARSITEYLTGERRIYALLTIADSLCELEGNRTGLSDLSEAVEQNSLLDDAEQQAENERWISVAFLKRDDLDTAIRFARNIDKRFVIPSVMAFVDIASNLLDRLGAPDPDED